MQGIVMEEEQDAGLMRKDLRKRLYGPRTAVRNFKLWASPQDFLNGPPAAYRNFSNW